MIALILSSAALPAPPTDWSAVPRLELVRPAETSPEATDFVVQEVAAGRCDRAPDDSGMVRIGLRLLVLADSKGQVRRIVPEAIGCPTVEQYVAGLIQRRARNNVRVMGSGDAWYVTSVEFSWRDAH